MSAKLTFHLITTIYYVLIICYEQTFDIPSLRHEKDLKILKGQLKALTIWNMLLQTFYFMICVVNDLIGTNENQPKNPPLIKKFKDILFTCFAFPIAMFVATTFWGMVAMDPQLLAPKGADQIFPLWLNHALHTYIVFFVLIELYISYHRYPIRKLGLTINCVFMSTYLVWIHFLYFYTGVWAYPIFQVLNLPLRLIFFTFSFLLSMGLYILGEKLNNLFWSKVLLNKQY